MTPSKIFTAVLLIFSIVCAVGCDSNPTNEPTQAEIEDAKAAQIKAIDADTTMTAEDKQRLKEMKGLLPGGRPAGPEAGRGK